MNKNGIVVIKNNIEKNIEENKKEVLKKQDSEQEVVKTPEDLSIIDNHINFGNDIGSSNFLQKEN